MKAYTTLGDGIAALKREERPTPRPGRNEVLVKMTAAALNYRDLLLTNGVRMTPTASTAISRTFRASATTSQQTAITSWAALRRGTDTPRGRLCLLSATSAILRTCLAKGTKS